jgi:hypothetical protein
MVKQLYVCKECYDAIVAREGEVAEYTIMGWWMTCDICGAQSYALIDYPLPIIEVNDEQLRMDPA